MNEKMTDVQPTTGKLGTFSGVFTPSILTILGIILFMRLGYVVGNAGIGRTLIIIGMANVISVLTSISLSAIATNLKVKGGGDYYLISRTLGLEFGGAIGIVLFMAQSISVAFYCIGFGEAVALMLPGYAYLTPRIIAVVAISLLFILAWLGADWATRFQYIVMTLLTLAIASFFIGGFPQWNRTVFFQNWMPPAGSMDFWPLFAIFFPAVTGFTQGVSMSGDLKEPGKSLPLGTFLAVGLSIIVYFAVALVFAGVLPNTTLMTNMGAMKQISWVGGLVDAGVISATLSSAMASFLGAPRILQSLSSDHIFNFLSFFAKTEAATNNPRRAVLLTAGIAYATIGLGQLNLIARVVSMFFLISYGLLNYATYYEAHAASPSFRPRFHWFDKRLSLLGFLSCLAIMLSIDMKNGAIAISILFAIYQYLKRTAGLSRWADSGRSYHLQQVRSHLISAAKGPEHPRDWRPQLIVFTNDPVRRHQILQFAGWIEGGSGLTTAVKMIEGTGAKTEKLRIEAQEALSSDIRKNSLEAFPLVISAPEMQSALHVLSQAHGIGPLRVNTMLINWFDQLGKGISGIEKLKFIQNLSVLYRRGNNIIILKTDQERWGNLTDPEVDKSPIDVWWQDSANGNLMLLFAYLMTRNDLWEDAGIRLLVEESEEGAGKDMMRIKNLIEEYRIDASPEIIKKINADTVVETSKNASMVFFPFRIRQYKLVDASGYSLQRILNQLPAVSLVLAAEDVDLTAGPDEGEIGEVATALDAFEAADKRVRAAEKEMDAANKTVEKLKKDILTLKERQITDEAIQSLMDLEAELTKTQEIFEKAYRKAAREKVKAEDVKKTLENLGLPIDREDQE